MNSETPTAGEPPKPGNETPKKQKWRRNGWGSFTPVFPQDVPIEHRGPFPGARVNGKFATRADAEEAGIKDWYIKPRMPKPWGLRPGMSMEDAKALDLSATDVQKFDREQWTILQRRAGIGDKWDLDKVKAFDELGRGMYVKLMARVLAVRNFTTLDEIDLALKFCQEQMNNKDLVMDARLQAVRMFSEVVKARSILNQQTMELCIKGQEKEEVTKPRNLPPMLGVSVNVNPPQNGQAGSTQVIQIEQQAPATNGDGEPQGESSGQPG